MNKVWPRAWVGLSGSLLALLVGCGTPTTSGGGATEVFLKRPSKSGTIAITGDDKYVVQVNPEDKSISIFRTSDDVRTAKLEVGNEPSSVVIHPDNKTAFVSLRADAKVVRVKGIDTNTPFVDASADVGSEPTGLALTPCGDKLAVAEFGQSRVALLNTSTLSTLASKSIAAPRAVAISNDGDTNCNNEKLVVTEFYGRIGPGPEASDNSRTGAVRILNPSSLADVGEVLFEPVSPGAFTPTNTSPNQLASIAIAGDKFFVTAVAASPDGVPAFNENVFPLLLIGSLSGSKIATVSLADEIKKQVSGSQNFLADLYDVATVGDSILYLVSRGGDAVQRVVLQGGSSVSLGTAAVKQIELLTSKDATGANIGCQNPIGMVTPHDTSDSKKSYVNCWVSRTTTVVDLGQQKAISKLTASNAPTGSELEVNKGRRFYFTGRARWSKDSWSSCGSCHPDGLSDNITWRFPAGPRQSTSMDGTFSHNIGTQKQRILNWSAIFDEVHDFERNTRGVSGGLGAITGGTCGGDLSGETRLSLNPADATDPNGLKVQLGAPAVKEVQDGASGTGGPSCVKDWDEINAFVKTIRPPGGRKFLNAASVASGRNLFVQTNQGNCASCHGGAGWTLSRLFYTPSTANNNALNALDFTSAGHTKMIQAEQTTAGAVAPAQVACVLRPVGTFGVPGNTGLTDSLEKKGAAGFPRAQGEVSGYNVPSLYGLQVGAPFLHNGQAKTLEELFSDAKWNLHLLAGNNVFAPNTQQRQDLVNFLLSIDASTAEATAPSGSDKCPTGFSP